MKRKLLFFVVLVSLGFFPGNSSFAMMKKFFEAASSITSTVAPYIPEGVVNTAQSVASTYLPEQVLQLLPEGVALNLTGKDRVAMHIQMILNYRKEITGGNDEIESIKEIALNKSGKPERIALLKEIERVKEMVARIVTGSLDSTSFGQMDTQFAQLLASTKKFEISPWELFKRKCDEVSEETRQSDPAVGLACVELFSGRDLHPSASESLSKEEWDFICELTSNRTTKRIALLAEFLKTRDIILKPGVDLNEQLVFEVEELGKKRQAQVELITRLKD